MKDIDLSYLLSSLSALWAIQKCSPNIAVIKSDLSFEAILLRPPYVAELTESTSGFVNVGLGAFMGTFVTTSKVFELSEIVDAVHAVPLHCWWFGVLRGIDVDHLGLFKVDVQTGFACKTA